MSAASGKELPVPPDEMIREHSGGIDRATYLAMGEEIVANTLIYAAALQPGQTILDLGCGCAKIARPLTRYLRDGGGYIGIDIGAACIAWCRQAFADYPNFRFHHADLFSARYNAKARTSAASYRFPVRSASVDVVFLGSVFTHMLPDGLENYLREIARVLKPGGRVIATYFVLDDVSRANVEAGIARPELPYGLPGPSGCRISVPDVPEAAIAYEEAFLREAYPRAGLTLAEIGHGRWGRGEIVPHWQDEVWGRKPADAPAPSAWEKVRDRLRALTP
ncbi:class I SAM-dependent methyltransferase [Phenylobacterium sp. J367]|uniref:class I SAM-dependent methyltransferase n=1 Tax=Phenylobacterium sp. J367 TaxID=2898435 RepID=UPI002151D0F0|nr:class I SAM-dependent methyltransferase [Phenylobacterium sp. J367]MCR5878090.1 class I SAM-dependent methyltransferase [Phenylobacterium sp. J367]